MTRRVFVIRDGELVEVSVGRSAPSSPFVHQDTINPLRNMADGKIYDSKSELLKSYKKQGLEVVGNDLQSQRKHVNKEVITDSVIMDRIERAEAILNDPSKLRARQEENQRRLERYERLMNGIRR